MNDHANMVTAHDHLDQMMGPKTYIPPENADHAKAMRAVDRGFVVVLDDARLAGGRFQVIAVARGGGREFHLITWHQDDHGNWRSRSGVLLSKDGATNFVDFVDRWSKGGQST